MALLAYQPDLTVAQEINSFIYQITQQDTIACSFVNHIDWQQIQNETLKKIKELYMHKLEPTVTNPQGHRKFLKKASQYYLISDGRLFKCNGDCSPLLVVLDQDMQTKILTEAHDRLGHKGEQAVYDILCLWVYWPLLQTNVHQHVSSCHECQQRQLQHMVLPPTISAPATIFEKVYIDVIFMPRSDGYRYIVCAKDDLTGVVEASALK